jgi:hypothetical protein
MICDSKNSPAKPNRVHGVTPFNSLLIVTGHAVVRCLLLLVALDAKTHRVIDNFLRHGHVGNIAMTGGTLDFGANMGGMIELNVRLLDPSVDALPRNVFALILKDLSS